MADGDNKILFDFIVLTPEEEKEYKTNEVIECWKDQDLCNDSNQVLNFLTQQVLEHDESDD